MYHVSCYQLAFLTPGTFPKLAACRKHSLHILNILKYALGRPQRGQRFLCLTLNLGLLFNFSIIDFVAICPSLSIFLGVGLKPAPTISTLRTQRGLQADRISYWLSAGAEAAPTIVIFIP